MKSVTKERAISATVVLGLAAVLILLAVLQYRWSGQVSEAERARMNTRLQTSVMGFRLDLHRELASICLPFQSVSEPDASASLIKYAEAYQAWKQSATHAGLIANVYVLQNSGRGSLKLLRLNPAAGKFQPDERPSPLGPLSERLMAASSEPRPPADFRHAVPPPALEPSTAGGPPRREFFRRGPLSGAWAVEQSIPALVHPIFPDQMPIHRPDRRQPAPVSWLIIQLAPEILREHIFPELAERHFGGAEGLEYEVAVLGATDKPVYSSDTSFGKAGTTGSDATMNLFGFPSGPPSPQNGLPAAGSTLPVRPNGPPPFHDRHAGGFSVLRFDPIHYSADEKDWQLVVKHRKGSLDMVVASTRRRNLAVSFGVLLVLAATMGVIIVATRRAQRLANLQLDFVTGISHELRTPLSVITSAADNIADGVVANRQQLARYGTVIKKQALQLNHLIEQVMLFAATRHDRLHYNLGPLSVADVINAALTSTEDLVHGAGVTVEQAIEPNLPSVMGDLPALSHCLQNLITNAVKYGGQDRWMAVRASTREDSRHGKHIQISVEDHGAGIARSEFENIFLPFYRGAAATAAQIHGTGLGLPLAKSIAEAMGGRLSVVSEPGRGSSFVLHLPVAEQTTTEREGEATVVNSSSPAS